MTWRDRPSGSKREFANIATAPSSLPLTSSPAVHRVPLCRQWGLKPEKHSLFCHGWSPPVYFPLPREQFPLPTQGVAAVAVSNTATGMGPEPGRDERLYLIRRHAARCRACRKHMSPVKQIVKASITSLWWSQSQQPAFPAPFPASGTGPQPRGCSPHPTEMGQPHSEL